MERIQNTKSLRHFVKHLFLTGRVYTERKRAKIDVDAQLQRMRKSIIRMNLSYSDVDRLKQKIDNLMNWERRYAKFFKVPDEETIELRKRINALEQELHNEKEEKYKITSENNEKIAQLTESLSGLKSKTNYLLMERAKRQQRLKALENKIREKVDLSKYYDF
ncbi:hypothetical protein HYY70_05220 [Candidatus Woesearchaeota archaeon]|nr:hypothetical protein [Candidatus Woesearchaeota archaeon]